MHLFTVFSNCLAILFNILHPTDWHIVIFRKVRNVLVCGVSFFLIS